MLQYGHIINIVQSALTQVVLGDNIFKNMSLSGSLIYFEGAIPR